MLIIANHPLVLDNISAVLAGDQRCTKVQGFVDGETVSILLVHADANGVVQGFDGDELEATLRNLQIEMLGCCYPAQTAKATGLRTLGDWATPSTLEPTSEQHTWRWVPKPL